MPNFESAEFLEQHIQSTLVFYDPRVFSSEGGFYGCFLDNGDCYDPDVRQLVTSCRYVFNYATACPSSYKMAHVSGQAKRDFAHLFG